MCVYSDTLLRLVEYGEEDDDVEGTGESPPKLKSGLTTAKPFWALWISWSQLIDWRWNWQTNQQPVTTCTAFKLRIKLQMCKRFKLITILWSHRTGVGTTFCTDQWSSIIWSGGGVLPAMDPDEMQWDILLFCMCDMRWVSCILVCELCYCKAYRGECPSILFSSLFYCSHSYSLNCWDLISTPHSAKLVSGLPFSVPRQK